MHRRIFARWRKRKMAFRFILVGTSSLGLFYSLLVGLVEVAALPVMVASIAAYVISMGWNYVVQRNWTFGSDRGHVAALPRYLSVHAIGIGLNAALLWAGTEIADLHYILAQAFALACAAIVSYFTLKIWVFSNDGAARSG